jgi:hypothetical protein
VKINLALPVLINAIGTISQMQDLSVYNALLKVFYVLIFTIRPADIT